MIIYPHLILPHPLIQYSGATDPILSQTQFEVGLRQRQVFTHTEQQIGIYFLMDDFQFEFWKSWVQNVLIAGSMSFQIPLPGVDGIQNSTVKIVGGIFDWEADSNRWRVSCKIREEEPNLADPALVELLASLADGTVPEFISLCETFHLQLNTFYGVSGLSEEITEFINTYG